MIIYANNRSPKRIKKQVKKRQEKKMAEYNEWLKSLDKHTPNFSKGIKSVNQKIMPLNNKPYIRETPVYPSLQTSGGSCTKPVNGKVYTGDKMLGIGTLHKSNAVPIFNAEDALDQAKMRR
jgi:hypothetical protein